MTFWMSGNHQGHIFDILWMLQTIWEKIIFFIFLKIFASLLSNFGFKMKQNWMQNFWKCRFFKNEALNQKSGTVKVLGYAWTVFDDCGDLRNVILALPPYLEQPLENAGFKQFSKAKWKLLKGVYTYEQKGHENSKNSSRTLTSVFFYT